MTVEQFVKNWFPENHEYAEDSLFNKMQRALQIGASADLRSMIRDNAEMIRDKMIEFFRIKAELKHCRKSYYDRVKWYFEIYQDELFGIPKDEFLKDKQ